jgi:hypothetical protein
MARDSTDKTILFILGIIYLLAIAAVMLQFFTRADIGILWVASWIIILLGGIAFLIAVMVRVFRL